MLISEKGEGEWGLWDCGHLKCTFTEELNISAWQWFKWHGMLERILYQLETNFCVFMPLVEPLKYLVLQIYGRSSAVDDND